MKKKNWIPACAGMTKLAILLLAGACWGQNSLIATKMYSFESEYRAITGGYCGVIYGADTLHFVDNLTGRNLAKDASDMTVWVKLDTTLDKSASSTPVMSLTAYPIFEWDNAQNWSTKMARQYGVSLTEIIDGTSSLSFAASHDSVYAFHSTSWWGTAPVAAIVFELVNAVAADTFYVEEFGRLRQSGF